MNRKTTRAEARRDERSRRKTRSQTDSTPSGKANAICPVRLSAVGNEEVLRSTWTECLANVRAQLDEARFGGKSAHSLEAACMLLGVMATVFDTASFALPCCQAASQPHAPMARCGENLRQLGLEAMSVLRAAEGGQAVGEVFSRLTSILQRLPRPDHIAEIAVEVRVPWCTCKDCVRSYFFGPRILSCRHCYAIISMAKKPP